MSKIRYALQITWFQCRIQFFRQILLDLEHRQVSYSIFWAKSSTGMPWSTSNRIVQNKARFVFSPSLGKSVNLIEEIDGLSLIDASFAARDSPRPSIKRAMSPCHPLTLVMGVTLSCDTKYSLFDSILRAVFVGERVFFFRSNQPVAQRRHTSTYWIS